MGPDLEKAIHELSLRMQMIRAIQEDQMPEGALSEREKLILQLIAERGPLSVSQIADALPNASESTISMTITRLWRDRELVTKTINPDNQRVTLVEISDKGKQELEKVKKHRAERYQALFKAIDVSEQEKQMLIRICTRGAEFLDQMLGFDK